MRRAIIAALVLMLAAPAFAQETPQPRTDIAALRREAKADVAIRKALGDRSRAMESRLRDDRRYVELILRAGAVKAGDGVLDVASGGGYLALLFSALVGDKGHVDIHNTPGWIAQFPWQAVDKQSKVITNPNVGWKIASWNELEAPANTYDVVTLGRVYHDVITEGGDFELMNKHIFTMVKPGGYVMVEDHDADPEMPIEKQGFLHRVSHEDTTEHFTAAGFKPVEVILFDSKSDDQKFNVFRPGVKGRTDHFIAVFQKPPN
jgi:predicted methyltransferase